MYIIIKTIMSYMLFLYKNFQKKYVYTYILTLIRHPGLKMKKRKFSQYIKCKIYNYYYNCSLLEMLIF